MQGFLWIAPAFLYLAFFIAYPFFMSIYLSVSSARVGSPESHFVGLQNYTRLFADPVFWQTVRRVVSSNGRPGERRIRQAALRATAPSAARPAPAAAQAWIQHVSEGVAQHVEAEHGERNGGARPDGHPRRPVHERPAGAR